MDVTGAVRAAAVGGDNSANLPLQPPLLDNNQLEAIGRVRTRADLASLINARSDSTTIKTETSGQGEEPTEPMEDDDNDVVCIVNLDESNRVIYMDDPFGADDNYVYEGSDIDREGEELLEESGGDTSSAEEEHVEQVGGGSETREGDGGNPSQDSGMNILEEGSAAAATAAAADPGSMGEEEPPVEVEKDPVLSVKHPDNMYQAVRSIMSGGQDPVKLNPRMRYNRGEDPGFMTPGDERILRNANMCNMEFKRISSASFDPVSGRCYTCLNGEHKAWRSRVDGPVCVVLSAQHFPANIPADSAGECFRILRIENGTLTELADEL
jgi:hypothetical protein